MQKLSFQSPPVSAVMMFDILLSPVVEDLNVYEVDGSDKSFLHIL